MSYTLRGRVDSRLASALLPVLAACALAAALETWWPVELAGLMLGVGLALDVLVYDRVFEYQPGWVALPLGALELLLVLAAADGASVRAPLWPALGFYAGSWLVGQILGHAGFPLLRLSYGDDGGELGPAGASAGAVAAAAFAAAGGIAWANQPPVVHLAAGVHKGPIVIDRREVLVGERGAIVRGGIVIHSDDVTVKNVATVGGQYGFEIEDAERVVLDGVTVSGARMDGIHVRRAQVTIRNCAVSSPPGYTQGIDLSFNIDKGMSVIEGCTVVGGQQGIFVDSTNALVRGNRVSATSSRAISMTEMAMGMIDRNEITGAIGAGIECNDRSECMIEHNRISGTRADRSTDDRSRQGYGIISNFGSNAELKDNELLGNARGVTTFTGAIVTQHR
jgi:nitrous oxidase accessory protein NosD